MKTWIFKHTVRKAPYLKAKNSYLIKHPVITIALNERVVIMILSREI